MTQLPPNSIEDRLYVLRSRWQQYVEHGRFDQFIEFTVAINSLAEYFNRLRLPGLERLCEGLENAALTQLGDEGAHPIAQQHILSLQRQIETLSGSVETSRPTNLERRGYEPVAAEPEIDWIKPRSVWIIAAPAKQVVAETLRKQLQFFGFTVYEPGWDGDSTPEDMPLAVLFIPADANAGLAELARIAQIRGSCPVSQLIYLGEQKSIEPVVMLMRAGIDSAMPAGEQSSMVLNCIFDLVKTNDQDKYRVLVVEDSRVVTAVIQRTLTQHGIDTHAISEPTNLLSVLESYRPDLILMDMYMPRFNGVEATRVLRQIPAYSSLPIVYLSGESAVAIQVEALRLGGDQFLSKPFNPVLLAAVVKSKVERYRDTQRSTRLDGLTGLINHTGAKSRLKAMVGQASQQGGLTVAMIDIDHFKSINDTYGHPVGDQVIRGLAWLLKARLRSIDLIGRYGGEEFLIALPNATPEQARSVIDRIRMDFSALPHTHSSGVLHANFSAGIASYPSFDTESGLIEAADRALLQAKRLGRNRVEWAA